MFAKLIDDKNYDISAGTRFTKNEIAEYLDKYDSGDMPHVPLSPEVENIIKSLSVLEKSDFDVALQEQLEISLDETAMELYNSIKDSRNSYGTMTGFETEIPRVINSAVIMRYLSLGTMRLKPIDKNAKYKFREQSHSMFITEITDLNEFVRGLVSALERTNIETISDISLQINNQNIDYWVKHLKGVEEFQWSTHKGDNYWEWDDVDGFDIGSQNIYENPPKNITNVCINMNYVIR